MSGAGQSRAGDVTVLLARARDGDREALDALLPVVYQELRRVARRQLHRERPGHTLGVSGLVNEAYLRLVDHPHIDCRSREHFYAVAARAMRQVLIDYARKRQAGKRGGEWDRTSLDNKPLGVTVPLDDLLAIGQVLDRMGHIDERMKRVVEYRYFCGLTEEETAELLGVTTRTVQREWAKARAWLYKELYPER